MDRATIVGLLLGFGFVVTAILIGPASKAFWNPAAALIVLGGTLASTLIKFPASVVLGSLSVVRQVFIERRESPEELVRVIVRMSRDARKESLLAMERVPVKDPFLRRAVALVVDRADPEEVESVLRIEVAGEVERHERGQRLFRGAGQAAPAFGMIGTLIGLVQMLSRMDDPSKIGGSMAVAILTTFYGAALAYLVFLPIADKLAERTRMQILQRELIIQGLLAILAGHHPRLVERRLYSLLGPGQDVSGRLPRNRLRPAA